MKKELTFKEEEQLKKAILLVEEGLWIARSVLEDYEERNNFENSFNELEELVLELSPALDKVSKEVIVFNNDKDYLKCLTSDESSRLEKLHEKTIVIHELSKDLNRMTEPEEVELTLKLIEKVTQEKITEKDKEYINDILNYSIQQRELEAFKKVMYKELATE